MEAAGFFQVPSITGKCSVNGSRFIRNQPSTVPQSMSKNVNRLLIQGFKFNWLNLQLIGTTMTYVIILWQFQSMEKPLLPT